MSFIKYIRFIYAKGSAMLPQDSQPHPKELPMVESQTAMKQVIHKNFQTFKRVAPTLGAAYEALPQEAHADGALSGKVKRLMALAAALTHGCRGCILFQLQHALDLGASVDEIAEACGVAMSLGGTMAASETTRVVAYLQENGLLALEKPDA
jgi:AhpD family alkylhydroperoxidase